ncbi:hypothetical protein GEMRC1_012511 [Eukaryota sp. GEM-RC1]
MAEFRHFLQQQIRVRCLKAEISDLNESVQSLSNDISPLLDSVKLHTEYPLLHNNLQRTSPQLVDSQNQFLELNVVLDELNERLADKSLFLETLTSTFKKLTSYPTVTSIKEGFVKTQASLSRYSTATCLLRLRFLHSVSMNLFFTHCPEAPLTPTLKIRYLCMSSLKLCGCTNLISKCSQGQLHPWPSICFVFQYIIYNLSILCKFRDWEFSFFKVFNGDIRSIVDAQEEITDIDQYLEEIIWILDAFEKWEMNLKNESRS